MPRVNAQDLALMSYFYLFDASWLFFAAWSVAVIIVGIKAFGRDFFPTKNGTGSQAVSSPVVSGKGHSAHRA